MSETQPIYKGADTPPAEIKPFANRFEGNIDAKDIIMPLGVLIQGNATEREKYPNALPGQIINNITQQPLGDRFIPLITTKQWIRFNQRDPKHPDFDNAFEPGSVIWKSSDPNDPKVVSEGEWRGTKAEPETPLATAMIKIVAYFPGFSLPVMLSFSKTGYKSGKSLLTSILAMSDQGEQVYRLTSVKKTGNGNTWYIPFATCIGKATDDDTARAQAMYAMVASARKVEVHGEEEGEQVFSE